MAHSPITASVLTTFRKTARLFSMHYSPQIEGNRLTQEHFPGREGEGKEEPGYYAALEKVDF